MKKVFIVVSLFIGTGVAAQVVEPKSGFGVAIRTGVSYFRYTSSDGSDLLYKSDKPTLALGVSLFHEKSLNSHLNLRTQLSYLERGSREIFETRSQTGLVIGERERKSVDRYISPDVSLKYMFGTGMNRPYIQAGLRADVYLNSSILSNSYPKETARNTYYRPVNLSGFSGMGFSMKKWDVGVEYNSSFFAVNRPQLYISRQNFRTLNLQVGYRF